ncbi:hypothetical protein PPYR_07735 [Photinus pyralis]|uniref:Uncharacterized protein n=1 Tax=Photinus pyralis TaxID=7054 RepID=A0A5N4AR81_PHOPY|nr:hypothetical protein PPYR_07735 [Photinus pyralis]
MILDRIVLGIRDTRTQEKLLQEDKLTLEKAVSLCHAIESSAVPQRQISRDAKSEFLAVNTVHSEHKHKNNFRNNNYSANDQGTSSRQVMNYKPYGSQKSYKTECKNCGLEHKKDTRVQLQICPNVHADQYGDHNRIRSMLLGK